MRRQRTARAAKPTPHTAAAAAAGGCRSAGPQLTAAAAGRRYGRHAAAAAAPIKKREQGRVGAYTRTPSGSTRPRMSADSFSTCSNWNEPGQQSAQHATLLRHRHLPLSHQIMAARRFGGTTCRLRPCGMPAAATAAAGATSCRALQTEAPVKPVCPPGHPGSSWPPPSQTQGWPERGTAQHPPSAQGERGRHSRGRVSNVRTSDSNKAPACRPAMAVQARQQACFLRTASSQTDQAHLRCRQQHAQHAAGSWNAPNTA